MEIVLVARFAVRYPLPHGGKRAASDLQSTIATHDISPRVENTTPQAVLMKDFTVQVHTILGEGGNCFFTRITCFGGLG